MGDSKAAAPAGDFASDWRALRADDDIQFAPITEPQAVPPEPASEPGWIADVDEFLKWLLGPVVDFFGMLGRLLGISAYAIMWIVIALAVALVLLLIWRHLVPLATRLRETAQSESDEWVPDAGEALALLDDADRLAAEGRYDEATHLLLQRSVGQIAAARPDLLEPSSTAREISVLPALPEAARNAFAVIAGRVERSLFALRRLSVDDWHAARAAYADFALAAPQVSTGLL